MNQRKRRSTYQYGTLVLEKRNRGPNVWIYRYFEIENGNKRRRKSIVGTQEDPNRSAAERSSRASAPLRECGNQQPRKPHDAWSDRPLHRPGASSVSCDPGWWRAGQRLPDLLSLCDVLQAGARQVGAPAMGDVSGAGIREARSSSGGRRMAPLFGAVVEKSKGPRAEDRALHLERDEAHVQIRCEVGLPERKPMGEKRVELPRGSTKRTRHSVQLTAAEFFRLLDLLDSREKLAVAFAGWLGSRVSEIFGLQWQDLDLQNGAVSFRRGFVQGRITPLKTEASRTNLPLPDELMDLLRQWKSITPFSKPDDWIFASPYTKGKRPFWPAQLLKKHIKPLALAAGLPSIGWHSFRHTVSAWGKEAGLKLEDVKTLLRHEDIATTSNVYGDLGMDAKRRIQQRLVSFVNEQAKATENASRIQKAWARMPVSIQ